MEKVHLHIITEIILVFVVVILGAVIFFSYHNSNNPSDDIKDYPNNIQRNENPQNIKNPVNATDNSSSLGLSRIVSFLDYCTNDSIAKVEYLKNLTAEQADELGFDYTDVLTCRNPHLAGPPVQKSVEQLKDMGEIKGVLVYSDTDRLDAFSISRVLNSSCSLIWNLRYMSQGDMRIVNNLKINKCTDDYYFSVDTYRWTYTADTQIRLYKISDSSVPQVLSAIKS